MDSIKGTAKSVAFDRIEPCPACKGTGGKNGSGQTACPHCRGTGMQSTRRGNVIMSSTCPNCEGAGSILRNPCKYLLTCSHDYLANAEDKDQERGR